MTLPSATTPPSQLDGIPLTWHADMEYGNNAAQKMDVMLPTTGSNHALVVFFHGGGFINGDKDAILNGDMVTMVADLIAAGIAVASCNYRLNAASGETKGAVKAFKDAISAIQNLKESSANVGINPNKIAAHGKSAGAGLAMFLAYYGNRAANPNSANPVKQQSSSVLCVSAQRPQGTYDLIKWNEVFSGDADFETYEQSSTWEDIAMQFYGTDSISNLTNDYYLNYRRRLDYPRYMRSNSSPVYIENEDDITPTDNTGVAFHSPKHAKYIYDLATIQNATIEGNIPAYSISSAQTFTQFLINNLI